MDLLQEARGKGGGGCRPSNKNNNTNFQVSSLHSKADKLTTNVECSLAATNMVEKVDEDDNNEDQSNNDDNRDNAALKHHSCKRKKT